MKNARKLICAILAAALLILTAAPAFAVEVDWGSGKLYLGSSDDRDIGGMSIDIESLSTSSKITDIKSSDTSVIRIGNLNTWNSFWQDLDESDEVDESHSGSIYIMAMKKGTATVSFKVDGTSYSKTYEVLGYANPFKTFTVTGVSTKNLKSKFNKHRFATGRLSADAKAGKINVATKSNWKITSISWSSESGGYRSFDFGSGVKSAKMPIPKMKKKKEYYINVSVINTKTKANADFTYYLR